MKIEIFPDADAIARSRLLSVQTDGVPPPTGIKVHNSTDFLFSVSQSEYWGMAEKYFLPAYYLPTWRRGFMCRSV